MAPKRRSGTEHLPAGNKKRSLNNHIFSDSYVYTGIYKTPTVIEHIVYNRKKLEKQRIPVDTKSFSGYLQAESVNWFNVTGLTDYRAVNRLLDDFGFDAIDGKDVLTPHHVVKVDDFGDHVIVVMGSCFLEAHKRLRSEHVCILVKENLILSFSERDNSLFGNAEENLRENVMDIRSKKSGMLLAFLLNSVFGQLIATALYVEERLEEIEKVLLDSDINQPNMGRHIQQARHANLIIRKNTKPLREEFGKLLREQAGVIDKPMYRVFAELGDQLEYIIETSENSKEILSSLEDLYVSHNDLKMNAVMKRLTVVSTLFIPITFLVGVWGMNFEFMPELEWKWGYIFSWLTLIATAAGTWFFMKTKKWF